VSYVVEDLDGQRVTFDPGRSLLLTGPTSLVNDRFYDVLAGDPDAGDVAIVLSTDRSAAQVVAAFSERGAAGRKRLGVVDVTEDAGVDVEDAVARQLGSAGDLTGVSLEFAKLLDGFESSEPDAGRVRVGLDSVSTLLMYTDVRTVFRFLHVFTSRIRTSDLLGAFTLTPEMHDAQTTNTVRAIFDCEIRAEDSGVELRGSGFDVE
jgi:hypothetical protein